MAKHFLNEKKKKEFEPLHPLTKNNRTITEKPTVIFKNLNACMIKYVYIYFEIFRCIKCHKKRAAAVRYVNPALSSSDTQNPLVDERVTIVLEEIDHNNVTQQDETPEVVVEYSNLKSYRVSLDQFIREVDNKREKDGFREEFKVLNAVFYTYNIDGFFSITAKFLYL